MREIVFDTETTGLDPKTGHRLIEFGGVEMINRIPTGREFHRFINPQRDVPREAQEIHGISTESLIGKPLFKDVVGELLEFLGDAVLVAQCPVRYHVSQLRVGARRPQSDQL